MEEFTRPEIETEKYVKPEMEVVDIADDDIILASGGGSSNRYVCRPIFLR